MRAFAYCCAEYEQAVRRAAGVSPLLSPPMTAATFRPSWLEGHRLLLFGLHGAPGTPEWHNLRGDVALTVDLVRQANLAGAVVFATSCNLGDPASPMRDAFFAAGAAHVIAGEGINYASRKRPGWASLLALWVRRGLAWDLSVERAVALGKVAARLHSGALVSRSATRDTLAFRTFSRSAAEEDV